VMYLKLVLDPVANAQQTCLPKSERHVPDLQTVDLVMLKLTLAMEMASVWTILNQAKQSVALL